MQTFLEGSGHEEFKEWLMSNFKFFDGDKSSAIELDELRSAVRRYENEMEERAQAGGEKMARAIRKVTKLATRMRRQCMQDASLNGSWYKVRELFLLDA